MQAECTLIIDSCCDLPYSIVNREGVYLVEFPYLFGAEEHLDDLYRTASAHGFFERMRKGEQPTTAQVPIPAYMAAFEWAAAQGKPCVFLGFSSALSGSFSTACLLADQARAAHPGFELYMVDTKLASVAEALLIHDALDQRDKGLSAQELAHWAEEARYFVNALFMVDDLESLRRGGRIPDMVASAGSKLDVKPLLSIDLEGGLTLKGVARGRKKGIKQLAEYYAQRVDRDVPMQCVIIGDADCPKDASRLIDAIGQEEALFLKCSIGPVIGSHVGPDMLAVVFWGRDRREDLSVADRIARRVKNEG